MISNETIRKFRFCGIASYAIALSNVIIGGTMVAYSSIRKYELNEIKIQNPESKIDDSNNSDLEKIIGGYHLALTVTFSASGIRCLSAAKYLENKKYSNQ